MLCFQSVAKITGSAQKLISDLQDSEIARFFVVLPRPHGIAFGVPNRAPRRIESLCHVVG